MNASRPPSPSTHPRPAAFAVEGKIILVIADAPVVLEVNGRIAWQMGYTPSLPPDPNEAALIRLAERQQRPDFIISDYHLASGKTGIRAIEQINAGVWFINSSYSHQRR